MTSANLQGGTYLILPYTHLDTPAETDVGKMWDSFVSMVLSTQPAWIFFVGVIFGADASREEILRPPGMLRIEWGFL